MRKHFISRTTQLICAITTAALLATHHLNAQTADSGAGREIINQIIGKMNNLKSFKADISINREGAFYQGKLSYQNGKLHIKFSDGRVIAADEKELVVFNPAAMVAGRQNLDEEEKSTGLGWLLNGYQVTEMEPEKKRITLTAGDPKRRIQEARLEWLDGFLLKSINYKTANSENWTVIALANITPVSNLSAGLFSWRPPAESRTVTNPLNNKN